MGSTIPNPAGLPEIRDLPPVPEVPEQIDVTPLKWFLMKCPLDDLANLMEKLHLRFTLVGGAHDRHYFEVHIWTPGDLQIKEGGKSVKSALCNAMAQYFMIERRDYHDVIDAHEKWLAGADNSRTRRQRRRKANVAAATSAGGDGDVGGAG